MIRRYTFKLYPTEVQTAQLHEQRRMCAAVWNAMLQRREDVYRRERRSLSMFDLGYEITDLHRECPEWRALSTWTARQISASLTRAFDAFFRRLKAGEDEAGYPRYKRVDDGDSIPHRCASGCRLLPTANPYSWRLRLKGITGDIHARGQLPAAPTKWTDADVMWRDDDWWLSICVELPARRQAGAAGMLHLDVQLGIIDGLARVNGVVETPDELIAVRELQDSLDALKTERDRRWTRRSPDDPDWVEAVTEIRHLAARIARKRRNALHVWSARLVRRASSITVTMPPIAAATRSPRGSKNDHGAAIKPVSGLNREVLNCAPAAARAMLEYKAIEAGVPITVMAADVADTELAISDRLVAAGKALRRARRAIKTDNERMCA